MFCILTFSFVLFAYKAGLWKQLNLKIMNAPVPSKLIPFKEWSVSFHTEEKLKALNAEH